MEKKAYRGERKLKVRKERIFNLDRQRRKWFTTGGHHAG